MNRFFARIAAGAAALLLAGGLAACGQPADSGSVESQPDAPSAQEQEASSGQEASLPQGVPSARLAPFQLPNGAASIQLPDTLSQVDSGLDNTLVVTDGSVVVTLTVSPKDGRGDQEALDQVQQETREVNVHQGGVEPVEQEAPALPFATAFRGDLYEGVAVENLTFTLYTAHFTTQDSVVVCEMLTPRDSWEGERETLLSCLSTFQEG